MDAQDTDRVIKKEIRNADGVVAIATPRNYDQITSTWRRLEWFHGEAGISYGIDRPLLIIREGNVRLEGLPKYLTSFDDTPIIHFTADELDKLIYNIDSLMLYYRESVNKKRVDKFFAKLFAGGTILLAGIGLSQVLNNAFDGFGWTQRR
jgi:hypothetical protein